MAVWVAILVVALGLSEVSADTLVDYYEDLIITGVQDALEYELDEDATRYEAENETILEFGNFDFIIIGAGSTGAVIANRLSEVEEWKILLLEAGTFPDNLTEIPAMFAVSCFTDYNWGFMTVPQTTACLGTEGQKCVVYRGRGLGGTTIINDLMYSRGNVLDYDKWADHVNDDSWKHDNVLPYFKKSEDFNPSDPDAPIDYAYHGTGGYWSVEHHHPDIPLKSVFLDANAELGYNFTDYNGQYRMGPAVAQYNTINGKRHDQGRAFIYPILDRENLTVQTESYVTKIEIDSLTNEATGVIFTYQNQTYRATADKEVILSAGAISTPQILILSGIGPQDHLEDLEIPVIQNLSVGTVLRGHAGLFGLQFSSNLTATNSTLAEQIEEYLNGTGPLTSNTRSHVIGWYKSSLEPTPDYPDLQLVIDVSAENTELGQRYLNWNDETWDAIWGNRTSSFYLALILLHAESVGSVTLNSNNPFQYPLIDYNLLSDPDDKDIDTIYDSINFALDLVNTTAFQEIGATFIDTPLPACSSFPYLSTEYWYCYIRQLTIAIFHPVGTCPIGTDPLQGAVVNTNLTVFGVSKLRVADSSVFPFTLSSHPSADCAMIGEKISDIIKLEYV